MKLTDESPMPFGKYQGMKMEMVPASYLHWFWHEVKPWNEEQIAIHEYIKDTMSALKIENPNLIWKK